MALIALVVPAASIMTACGGKNEGKVSNLKATAEGQNVTITWKVAKNKVDNVAGFRVAQCEEPEKGVRLLKKIEYLVETMDGPLSPTANWDSKNTILWTFDDETETWIFTIENLKPITKYRICVSAIYWNDAAKTTIKVADSSLFNNPYYKHASSVTVTTTVA